jgi:hypothetical protein
MTSTEERMRILRMIENGQLTAEEGARLLGAMDDTARPPRPVQSQWVHVRVTDLRNNRQKVNVNIPVGLIGIGLKLGARFALRNGESVNMEQVLESIRNGARGKLVDIEDLEEGERLELIVE